MPVPFESYILSQKRDKRFHHILIGLCIFNIVCLAAALAAAGFYLLKLHQNVPNWILTFSAVFATLLFVKFFEIISYKTSENNEIIQNLQKLGIRPDDFVAFNINDRREDWHIKALLARTHQTLTIYFVNLLPDGSFNIMKELFKQ